MKKSLIILALLPLLFFGCKKGGSTDDPKPEEELFEVNFKTTGFQQSIDPWRIKSSNKENKNIINVSGDELISQLEMFIFDQNDNLVTSKINNMIDADMKFIPGSDQFSFKLPKGNYKYGIISNNNSVGGLTGNYKNFYISYFAGDNSSFNKPTISYRDLFLKPITNLTLSSDTSFSSIKLNRINSKLNLIVKDEKPKDVGYILIGGSIPSSVTPFGQYIYNRGSEAFINVDISNFDEGANSTISTIMFPKNFDGTDDPIDLMIFIYNKSFQLLGSKKITNVLFKPNHITTLTGNLYDSLNKSEAVAQFKVDYIKEYSTEIINKSF